MVKCNIGKNSLTRNYIAGSNSESDFRLDGERVDLWHPG